MAKNNPSLADLSRMRREARNAKREDLADFSHEASTQETLTLKDSQPSVEEATGQETRQNSQVEAEKRPPIEEAKIVEVEDQTSSRQPNFKSEIVNDSRLKLVPAQTIFETDEQKKVGRPRGIRSNPQYESTTIRLDKQIKAKARYILSTQPEKMDLQTLLNNLLEDFVREQDSQ
jgi:hypothetical protein